MLLIYTLTSSFLLLLLESRLMTLYYVICYMTAVIYLFLIKEKKTKKKIKRKIDRNEEKC